MATLMGRRRFLGVMGACLPAGLLPSPSRACPAGPLGGTFLQPLAEDLAREPSYWRAQMGLLRELGMRHMVVQWCRYGEVSFLPMLPPLMEAAAKTGIAVRLGLASDPSFWGAAGLNEAELERRLAELRATSLELGRQIVGTVGGSSAFAGWYLPEEIDDISWMAEPSRRLLVEHLADTASGLAKLARGRRVAVSTFVSGQSAPEEFGRLWQDILARAPLAVLVQDGQGVHALPEHRLVPYFQEIDQAAGKAGRSWLVIIEMFRQLSGTPIDEGTFSAEPAPFERVERQIALARRFQAAGQIAFTVRDYMLDARGGACLADLYRRRFCEQ